jgi:DNA polymerase III delta prime subunit
MPSEQCYFMQSKLILLEGIPGSGKTTAAINLQSYLENNHIPSRFWREGDFDHPADFEGTARLTKAGYQDLALRYPEMFELFQEHTSIREEDYLLKYRKLQHLHPHRIDQALIDELSRFDVYDGLPMDEYCRLALDRWQDFCEAAMDSDEISLLECCFLQNPLTVLLARHVAAPQFALQQIEKMTAIIRELNPLVIYLQPQNVTQALQHVRAERPKEWADFVTWYLTEQKYGQTHNLKGYEGVIQFYEMRQKLEIEILRSLPIHKLIIEHSGNEWEWCNSQIRTFISPFILEK